MPVPDREQADGVLVCLNHDLRPVVDSYAALTGARTVIDSPADLPSTAACVTLVGLPAQLGLAKVRDWMAHATGTLGVIAGRDELAVRFLMAKQLLTWSGRRPWTGSAAMLDELHGQISLLGNGTDLICGAAPASGRFAADTVLSTLARDLDLLHLHVHGDGAHANLRHTVLCGQNSDEAGCAGSPEGGCRRAGHTGGRHVLFDDLRVSRLLFFSCNGFTVGGELHPGADSAILAAAEGFVAAVVCNERPVPTDVDLVRASFALAGSQGLASTVDFLNEARPVPPAGARPWLLVGDPGLHNEHPRAEDVISASFVDKPAGAVRVLGRVVAAVTGNDRVLIVGEERCDVVPAPAIEVESDRIAAALRQLALSELQLDMIAEQRGAVPQESQTWVRLRAASDLLRMGLGRAGRYYRDVRLREVCDERALHTHTIVDKLINAWAVTYAHAMADLLDGHPEEAMLLVAMNPLTTGAGSCDRCEAPTEHVAASNLAALAVPWSWVVCPTCGLRDVVCGETTGLAVRVPRLWYDGDCLDIEVCAPDHAQPPRFAFCVRDKARGTTPFRMPVRSGVPNPIRVPWIDLSPDLHTLKFLYVDGTGWSIHRRRVAAVGRRPLVVRQEVADA
jgi:hypothetical protein